MNWRRDRWLEAKDNPNVTVKMWQPRPLGEGAFKAQYLSEWLINDAVYTRQEVGNMLARGEISEKRADEMLQMRYDVNRKGEKVVRDEMH